VAWGLNNISPQSIPILCHRLKEETNIASSGRKLIRVFNALFGIEPKDDLLGVIRVVRDINAIRDYDLSVDISDMKRDSFGVIVISIFDRKARYELQSFKPIHFGFVRAETLRTDARGCSNYRIFRRLVKYVCNKQGCHDVAVLALASLFDPYHLIVIRRPRFEFLLLSADMEGPQQRIMAIHYADKYGGDDPGLRALCQRIRSYKDPHILPRSHKKAAVPSNSPHKLLYNR